MSVSVTTESEFSRVSAKPLFPFSGVGGFDVFPDGERFLTVEPVGPPPEPKIHVVQNWHEEFRDQQED